MVELYLVQSWVGGAMMGDDGSVVVFRRREGVGSREITGRMWRTYGRAWTHSVSKASATSEHV